MVNVIIILLSFISLTLGNDVMSPFEELMAVDKNNHLTPEEAITIQVEGTKNYANQQDDDENDNFNRDYVRFDHRRSKNIQSLDNLNDMNRASTTQSRVVQKMSPWNDLSAASSNSKSNGHQGFFQYARMPAEGAWEFGYRRGNHEHFTERHEHGASHHFKSKVRWGDKLGGYGEHYFDFNHKGTGDDPHVLQRNQQIKSHFSSPNYAAASSASASIVASNSLHDRS